MLGEMRKLSVRQHEKTGRISSTFTRDEAHQWWAGNDGKEYVWEEFKHSMANKFTFGITSTLTTVNKRNGLAVGTGYQLS
ncbi:hypothetical protein FRB95_003007 [Tulasnella sp. JGI-2019a]|nr:hypothetical protein FRB95_003007 [Tulasnella sp. JGI-2019a]